MSEGAGKEIMEFSLSGPDPDDEEMQNSEGMRIKRSKAFSNAHASEAIIRAATEGRLIQGAWHVAGGRGRKLACLLGSIDPSVESASDCNGDLMPQWMADLTVMLFDGLPKTEVVPIALRYGTAIAKWNVLSVGQWTLVLNKFLIAMIDQGLEAARPVCVGKSYWAEVEAACEQCKTAVLSGDDGQRKAAEARAVEALVVGAVGAELKEAEMAAEEAAWVSVVALREAAAEAAEEAAWVGWARTAWAQDVKEAVYLKFFTFLLDQVEAEIARGGGK